MSTKDLQLSEFAKGISKTHGEIGTGLSKWWEHHAAHGQNPLTSVVNALNGNLFRLRTLADLPFAATSVPTTPPIGMQWGIHSLDHLIGTAAWSTVSLGLESLMAGVVISSWTTFEVFATDLWTVAVNVRPKLLGSRVAKSPAETAAGKNLGKSIQFFELEKRGFDIKHHVGELLAEKFNFTKLEDLKAAYKAAFGPDLNIVNVVSNADLFAVAQVRHILVHRAGTADEEFLGKTKGSPLVPITALNTPLFLDGKLTVGLADVAVRSAYNLLLEVHGWLAANKEAGQFSFNSPQPSNASAGN